MVFYTSLGMTMGRVFLGTRLAPNGRRIGIILLIWDFFFKTRVGFGVGMDFASACLAPPRLGYIFTKLPFRYLKASFSKP